MTTSIATETNEIPIPALLRAARGSYIHAIRRQLVAAGCGDLPPNGPYVLGGLVNQGGSAQNLIRALGVSKQAASQLVEALVAGGYVERQPDPADGRRITLVATARGRTAAAAVRAGVQAVDAELAGLLTPSESAGLRAGLVALCDIRERMEDEARAERGTSGRLGGEDD